MQRPLRKWLTQLLLPPTVLVLSANMCATAGNCSSIPLPEYDQQFTQQWLEETATVQDASALGRYLTDANQLRGAVRACNGK